MQVHIWPRRIRDVAAPNAAIRVQASCVASSVGSGTVWKWSYTQTDSHGPASAARATPSIACHWSAGSMPTRSSFQPWGMKSPNRTGPLYELADGGRRTADGGRRVAAPAAPTYPRWVRISVMGCGYLGAV